MKSVQKKAPLAVRPVPEVRGKSSPNGQPAGAGSVGATRVAAAGTPAGSPDTGPVACTGAVTAAPRPDVTSAADATRPSAVKRRAERERCTEPPAGRCDRSHSSPHPRAEPASALDAEEHDEI